MKNIFLIAGILCTITLLKAQDPAISVNPTYLQAALYTGETDSQQVIISNSGEDTLDCTMSVEPISPPGFVSYAIWFDGVNDYARVYNNESLQINEELSIEVWIKFETGNSVNPTILSKGYGIYDYEISLDTNLETTPVSVSLNPVGNITSQSVLSAGEWYHIAFTYDGTTMMIYINGFLDNSQEATGLISISNNHLYIGRRYNSTQHYFKGTVDDLRIWHTARSQVEILEHMNHELSGEEDGLAGYWKFNETGGSTSFDATPNGNNCSLLGGVMRVESGAPIFYWLYVNPVTSKIPPGESGTLDVVLDATGLDEGTYEGQINIQNNDPMNPIVTIPAELNVTGVPIINVSEDELDFGEVFVGAMKTLSFIISNSGNDTLDVMSITCPNQEFSISPVEIIIPPEASDTVNVTYTPSQPGNDLDLLTINSNDYLTPSVTISLSGTGQNPPIINVEPGQLDTVLYSGEIAMQYFTISNSGESDLEWQIKIENASIVTVTFTKEDYADWTDPANQDHITDNVYITRANSQGIFNANNEISYNWYSPDDTEWAYGYSADLEPGDYQVWRDAVYGNPPGMVNNPISMHLISDDLYFDVLFHSWTGGGDGGGFSYTRTAVQPPWIKVSQVSGTIIPGSSQEIMVTYDATLMEGGEYEAIIATYSNDPATPVANVETSLEVIDAPNVLSEVDTLDFGILYVGYDTSDTLVLSISNTGSMDLLVTGVSASPDVFDAYPAFAALDPGDTENFYVIFTPDEIGSYSGVLTLTSNDPLASTFEVVLLGQYLVPPLVSATPMYLDTILYSGKNASQFFTISNTGGSDLVWEISLENAGFPTVTFTKANYADWTDPANQDRITDNVYITRANSQGIFNFHNESGYNWTSPNDTEWAYGYSADLQPDDYTYWRSAVYGNPPGMVNNPISMHLISEDLYFDVLFHSWTSGGNGGGFSYTRTSVNPPWLLVSQESGVIPAGSSTEIEVTFNAALLEAGIYEGAIVISSNDPANPAISIVAQLEVIDAPSLLPEKDSLDFGLVYTGYEKTLELIVANNGSQDLLILQVEAQPEEYSVFPPYAGIDPGETEIFEITFSPQAIGNYDGTLTFSSNDPLYPEYIIPLSGECLDPPVILVSPDSLDVELMQGQSTTEDFTIYNNGGSDLHFTLTPGEASQNFALEFDGNDDFVDMGDNISLDNSSMTLEVWVRRPPILGIYSYVFGQGDDYWNVGLHVGFRSDNTFTFAFYGNDLDTPEEYTDTDWHHWACTYDVNTMNRKIYLDGIEVASDIASDHFYGSGTFYVGRPPWGWEYFYGCIDEVRIWNVERTQEQILQYMSNEIVGNEPGLLGYWDFDEGSGQAVYDKTQNGNNGVLMNGPSWIEDAAPISPAWIVVTPEEGTVPAGGYLDIEALFDAGDLPDGDYYATIRIENNDPVSPLISLPAHMKVGTGVGTETDAAGVDGLKLVCYPNPFSGSTVFSISLQEQARIRLAIYDIYGKEITVVADGIQQAGQHLVYWNAPGLPPGIYMYRMVIYPTVVSSTERGQRSATGKVVKFQ